MTKDYSSWLSKAPFATLLKAYVQCYREIGETPTRAMLTPLDIAAAIPNLIVLEYEKDSFSVKMVGSDLHARLHNSDPPECAVDAVAEHNRDVVKQLFHACLQKGKATFVVYTASYPSGKEAIVASLYLPLRSNRDHQRKYIVSLGYPIGTLGQGIERDEFVSGNDILQTYDIDLDAIEI